MLKVENWPIDRLVPYTRNPRKNDVAVDKMVSAIREFGFRIPIVARSDGTVVDGHLRLKAAMRMGIAEVPVALADGLTDVQVKAFRLLANRSANWAEWDYDLLGLEIEELGDLKFDIDMLGFSEDELQHIENALNQMLPEDEASDTKPLLLNNAAIEDLAPTEEERSRLEGKALAVMFSGGKDSSAAAYWCRHFFPENETTLVFVDMGADFCGYSLFLNNYAKALGVKLQIERTRESIFEVFLRKKRWPGFMHPYCHDTLHGGFDSYLKQQDPEKIVVVRGGRLSEKAGKSKAAQDRYLFVSDRPEYTYFQPLYFAKNKDIGGDILISAGLPIWEGYSHGLQRTACRVCPGQKPSGYAAIRAAYPEVWDELLQLEKILGVGYWQDFARPSTSCLEAIADKGHPAFERGCYAPRFK